MQEKTLYSNYRWLMLSCISWGIMAASVSMLGFAPILGDIANDLKTDMGAATNLMMGFVLANASFLFLGGLICDKYGIAKSMVLGLLCAALPAVLMPWIGHDFATVFVARLVQGASMGFIFATVGPVLALWFPPEEQGLGGGLMIGSLSLGSALGVLISPPIFAATRNWQLTVAILSIFGWVGIVSAILIARKPPSPAIIDALSKVVKTDQQGMSFGMALALPLTWLGTLIVFCNAWGLYSLYNLIPPFLAAKAPVGVGLGPLVSGQISLALTITGVFAMVLGGVSFDKVAKGDYRIPMIFGFLLTGISTYITLSPTVYTRTALLVMCLIISGWGVPFMNASITALIARNYPPDLVGRMLGWWFGCGTFVGAAGLCVGGKSISHFGTFYWAILPISIACGIGLILSFLLKPLNPRGATISPKAS